MKNRHLAIKSATINDLEGYFESLALQSFQNNLFFCSGTKKWGLAPPSGVLTFPIVTMGIVLLLAACGANIADQCYPLKETINQGDRGAISVAKAEILQQAEQTQQLSQQLAALDIRDKKLQEFQTKLAALYRDRSAAAIARAEWMDDDGTVTLFEDDKADFEAIESRYWQIDRNIQLNRDLIVNYCAAR